MRRVEDMATVPFSTERTTGEATTVELPTGDSKPRRNFWRELSGAVAAGVVILAVIVLALEVISWVRGVPGLGVIVLLGHLVGAVLAVVAQRQLDRREGRAALLRGLALAAIALAVLVLFWWS